MTEKVIEKNQNIIVNSKNLNSNDIDCNDKLLKLMIKFFTKKILHKNSTVTDNNIETKMYSNDSNNSNNSSQQTPTATTNSNSEHHNVAKKMKNLETDLIRVEYYNDFNTCLSLTQTINVLNSGNYETAMKLATSINNTVAGTNQQTLKSPQSRTRLIQGNLRRVSDFSGLNESSNMTVTYRSDGEACQPSDKENQKLIKLERATSQSFGISIVGGKVNVSGDIWISGVFVKDIIPNSPADLSKQLKIGDRILAIDDIDLSSSTHQQAVNVIKKAGQSILVLVESLREKDNKLRTDCSPTVPLKLDKKFPPPVTPNRTPVPEIIQDNQKPKTRQRIPNLEVENENGEICRNVNDDIEQIIMVADEKLDKEKGSTSNDKSKYSSDEDEDEDDDEDGGVEMSGRTISKSGKDIDRASAGNIKRSKEEISLDNEKEDLFGYTSDKIKKKYGALGHVYRCEIDRNQSSYIGLSLAGHKDRNKMACFVAGINPKGIATKTSIQVGDEILEVNGNVLHGRCHLNASVIIKELPGNELVFILLRRQAAKEDLAVKPLKQFPLYLFSDDDDMFSNFKNVKVFKIKKGNQGLGIMIIEGRHSEAGQGIFISDIQEGSCAEQAGLAIGDMILSVNSEILLGCSYENAASLLKKSEGMLTLRVSSPSAKDNKENTLDNHEDNSGLRAVTPEHSKASDNLPKTLAHDRSLSASPLPKPKPSPVKEPPVDLLTAPILPNKESAIELNTDGKGLGFRFVGGSNSFVTTGIVIVQIYAGGAAEKDKRLQVFDQILDVNGVKLDPTQTFEQIEKNVKISVPKVIISVYRADPSELTTLSIDFVKKSGKSIGIEMTETLPHGIIVTGLLPGSTAAADNRLQIGDIITHINNEDLRKLKPDECIAVMRGCQGTVSLKVSRPAPKKR